MKRYKELKYNRKTYTEQYKIDEILLKEGFQWFLDCEVEDVRLEISHRTLIFNSGTFFNGTWKYGVFRDGVWKYGIWEGGVWYNGKWYNGAFQSGIIYDGKFFHGKIEGETEIKGGEFYNIQIEKSVKREEKKKETQSEKDESVPQGEKITEIMKTLTKKSDRKIMTFEQFKQVNESHEDTKEEIWKRLMEIDELLSNMDKDTDEAMNLAGEYADLEAKLDALESMEDEQPEIGPEEINDTDMKNNEIEEDPSGRELDETPEHELSETPEEELAEHPFSELDKKSTLPPSTPQSRAEDWARLSTPNDSGRKMFYRFDDYLRSRGEDPDKYADKPEHKEKKVRSKKEED